jgi:O-antigen ligase
MALLFTVLGPLHSDLPSWAWSWWLLAAMAGIAGTARLSASGMPSMDTMAHENQMNLMGPAAACLLAACMIGLLMGAWHGEGVRVMRQDGKVLLVLPMVLLLTKVARTVRPVAGNWPGAREALGWAIGLQLLVAAVVALQWPRAMLPATAIPWATAVALGMAVLAPLVWARDGVKPDGQAWRVGLALALLAGAVAVVWSRSRAAWVVLPWLMVVAVVFSRRTARTAVFATLFAAVAVGAGLLYDSFQPPQVERGVRLLDLLGELRQMGHPDAGTSIGSRQLLWEAAWSSLWQHPWSGVGVAQRIELVQQVIPPERLSDVAPLVHVHQQFLNQAVDHGLPGLLAAMLSAAAPFALAWRAPPGVLRWQCLGIGVVHGVGLLFNANMTHGPYAFNLALALLAALLMHVDDEHRRLDGSK